MGFVKAIAGILLLGGLVYWAMSVFPTLPTTLFAENREAGLASPLPVAEDGLLTLEGVIIYGTATPPVPYIQYSFGEGKVRTKQLIYKHEAGCATTEGDLPCPFDDQTAQSPNLPYGQRVRVTGEIRGDQILIESIEQL